jgi:hypothetical protein
MSTTENMHRTPNLNIEQKGELTKYAHYIQMINKNTFKNKKEDNSSMEA